MKTNVEIESNEVVKATVRVPKAVAQKLSTRSRGLQYVCGTQVWARLYSAVLECEDGVVEGECHRWSRDAAWHGSNQGFRCRDLVFRLEKRRFDQIQALAEHLGCDTERLLRVALFALSRVVEFPPALAVEGGAR